MVPDGRLYASKAACSEPLAPDTIVGNGGFDWTDSGIENDEGEVDDATTVAKAKASISRGDVSVNPA